MEVGQPETRCSGLNHYTLRQIMAMLENQDLQTSSNFLDLPSTPCEGDLVSVFVPPLEQKIVPDYAIQACDNHKTAERRMKLDYISGLSPLLSHHHPASNGLHRLHGYITQASCRICMKQAMQENIGVINSDQPPNQWP